MSECPICTAGQPVTSVTRPLLPSMQDYVYRTDAGYDNAVPSAVMDRHDTDVTLPLTDARLAHRLREYADGEQGGVRTIRERLRGLRERGRAVAVWGIMFSVTVDPDSALIDYTADVNPNKQGGCVPLSGRRIEAPVSLRASAHQSVVVVVMNPNDLGEMASTCRGLGVSCECLDASGVELVAA